MNFEQFLQKKGILPKTIARQKREVKKYRNWLSINGKLVENIAKKDLLDYLQHIKQKRNLANTTQNNILQMLKNYHAYLTQTLGIDNITQLIKIRGTERKQLKPLFTPDELDLLCDDYFYFVKDYKPSKRELNFYPDYQTILQGRYIALSLIAYQAIQPNEILALKKSDFDIRKATVTIHENRRGASRILSLNTSQIGVIIQYFAENDKPIILNHNHFEHINKFFKKSHSKYVDFRQIRASVITNWIKIYGLRKAQYFAGHKYISGTERFIAYDFETLQNDFDNFHPLN